MQKFSLSVILPCYNESANLERGVLRQVHDYLSKQSFPWEVIISDDGSTDKSRDLVTAQIKTLKNFRLLPNPHGGKPSALLYGIKSAKNDYVLFADMDQSTPISELSKFLPFIDNGADVVIGSRGMERADFPFYRKLGSFVFATFRKSMLLRDIEDTQCGFKLFRRDIVAKAFPKLQFFKIKQRTTGWKVTSYDVELLHIISKMGVSIKEVTVVWRDEDVSKNKGGGLSRYFRESKEMLTQIVRVKLNDIRGDYKV